MYKTTVKEQFQDGFYKDEKYFVICDMKGHNKVLIFNPKTNLLSDIYKNKIKEAREETLIDAVIIVSAKNKKYAVEYNLPGAYHIVGCSEDKVIIKELHGESTREIFPSRLLVLDYEDKPE